MLVPLEDVNAKVWVFGSRARGEHKTFSDLDLLIDSENDVSAKLGQIEENLIESNLPYKVDLVLEKNLADVYRQGFLQDRVLF